MPLIDSSFIKIITLLFILFQCLPAQTNNRISVKENSFEISVENLQSKFTDEQKNNFTIRDYYEYTDESSTGYFKLPSRELIIAIPPNSQPRITLSSFKEQKYYNVIPALNPASELINDSTIVLKQVDYKNRQQAIAKPLFEVEGYFWFRDFYCVHLKLNTHQFDEINSLLTEYSDIRLKLEFDPSVRVAENSPIEIKSRFDETTKFLLANHQIAEQFRGTPQIILSDTTGKWINYSAKYLRIGTAADGLFRITKQDLESFGINTASINPKTFQLYESGVEVPIYVSGEDDNSFDNNDFIEFFGTKNYSKISARVINPNDKPYNNYLDKYTDTTVYFLTWNIQNGKRAKSIDTFVSSLTDSLTHYTSFAHFEENIMDALFYTFHNDLVESQFPFWDTGKGWYWMWLATWASNRAFSIPAVDIVPNKTARFYAKLTSRGSTSSTGVHLIKLFLNNAVIDSQVRNRYDRILLNGSVNSSSLISGDNTLRITYSETGGGANGQVLIDWVEAEYPRKLKLIDSTLYFEFKDSLDPALRLIKIENVSSSNYRLYKVKPFLTRITALNFLGNNLYFTDSVSTNDAYLLLRDDVSINKPIFFKYKNFVNLRNQNEQVDYIGITHSAFISSVSNYVDYISDNFNVSSNVYLVEDIFDEFGYGYPTAESIKDFIQFKFQSSPQPKPSYLVFFGDANYDYKGYRAASQGIIGGGNFVPSFGYPVSDQFYAVWNTSNFYLPQMYVGRIPINKNSELDYYKSKVQNNIENPYNDWNKRYLFFSGGRANFPDEIRNYKSVNDSVINNFVDPPPLAGRYYHFYKTVEPLSDFGPYSESEIQNAIDQGAVFISYIGHSGTATWDNSISDVRQLKNKVNRNPILSDFGCSTNKFAEPDIVSFGERFILDNHGQALGYVGNSALGFVSTAVKAPGVFYKSIIQDTIFQIGKAHVNAKFIMYSLFGISKVNNQFAIMNTLMGDPIIEIKIPQKPNLYLAAKDLIFQDELLNDAADSILIKLSLNNYGTVSQTPFKVLLKHYYQDTVRNVYELVRNLPNFADSLDFWFYVYKQPGMHKLEVVLDSENSIDEIYENDNNLTINFNVASTSLRDLIINRYTNPKLDTIAVLSPSTKSNKPLKLIMQSSADENFSTVQENIYLLDTFVTKVGLPHLPSAPRTHARYKLEDAAEWAVPFSYSNTAGSKYFLNDKYSWEKQHLNNLRFINNQIELSLDTINVSVVSAGGYAGQYCIITKNGINLLSNTFFQGIGVVVLDEITYEVFASEWFEIFNNQAGAIAFSNFVNSIPPDKLVLLGISGDAKNNNFPEVNNAVLSLGGTRFLELQFKAPYVLFGKKGADSTQVKQFIKNPFEGPIQADTTLTRTSSSGWLQTSTIGPASQWRKLRISAVSPNNSEIKFRTLGVRNDGIIDTLQYLNIQSGEADLTSISSAEYPHLMINAEFKPDSLLNSPSLLKLEVDYIGLAELGTNFQAVKINKDTLEQGTLSNISFSVYNVGESSADNFRVNVDVIHSNNNLRILDSTISLDPGNKKYFTAEYPTTFESGRQLFKITIDDSSKVSEYYKDNNVYLTSIFIKADTTTPSLKVTFDGQDILNGDYVSKNPTILMEISDPSTLPIVDTSAITIFLDEKPIYFAQNASILSYSFNSSNPKMVVEYKPTLESGEHELKVFANDGFGNIADSSGLVKRFVVSNETQILNVFNYPNPVRQNTYFTFRLTQVPDKIKIMIYTISGRLVKEIVKTRNELTIDFNKIFWDCTDEDGDLLGNGTYLYKVLMNNGDKTETSIHKLAIVR